MTFSKVLLICKTLSSMVAVLFFVLYFVVDDVPQNDGMIKHDENFFSCCLKTLI